MKRIIGSVLALLVVASAPTVSCAEVTYGDNVTELLKYFQINNGVSGIFSVGDLAFDPTTPNQLYVANYVSNNDHRGVYSVNLFGEEVDISELDQTADVRILWELQARNDAADVGNLDPATNNGSDADYPAGLLVDSSGNLRVAYDRSESIWRVNNPLADPPTEVESQMFGAYGNSSAGDVDDDIISVDFVPAGFGGGFTAGSDIITFDQGHDGNFNFRIGVVSDSSTAGSPQYQEVFSETGLGGGTDNIDMRGDASSFDGFAYFARYNHTQGRTMFVDDIGNGDQPYIERVNGSGNHEYIFLDLPGGFDSLAFEDALQVNPADGSVWFVINNDGNREFYRVDVDSASHVVNSDYLAPTTLEISFTDDADENPGNDSYNVGMNSMAFSPDGNLLVVGAPDGRDRLFVYNLGEPSAESLPGDYNNDGTVDSIDYAVWREALGQSIALPNETASLGVVDSEDFAAWRSNFGATGGLPSNATAAPEPAAMSAILLGLLGLGAARRRFLSPRIVRG